MRAATVPVALPTRAARKVRRRVDTHGACRTRGGQAYCSLSPIHLDTRSDDETDMNVALASVASALARNDLPVPGG